jgi:hypothetical protein
LKLDSAYENNLIDDGGFPRGDFAIIPKRISLRNKKPPFIEYFSSRENLISHLIAHYKWRYVNGIIYYLHVD